MSEFPYEESYGPAYNYEVGYLEGLIEAHRRVSRFSAALADFFKKRIEEQRKAVKEEMPDE